MTGRTAVRRKGLSISQVLDLDAVVSAYEVLPPLLDIGTTTLAEMIKNGTCPIPLIRVGRQVRVLKVEILKFCGLQDVAVEIQSAALANGDGPGVTAPDPSVALNQIHSSADR